MLLRRDLDDAATRLILAVWGDTAASAAGLIPVAVMLSGRWRLHLAEEVVRDSDAPVCRCSLPRRGRHTLCRGTPMPDASRSRIRGGESDASGLLVESAPTAGTHRVIASMVM